MIPRPTRAQVILLLGFAVFIAAYWRISIPGQVFLAPDNWQEINAWPQVRLDSEDLQPGQKASLVIFDTTPWAYVKLIVEGTEGTLEGHEADNASGVVQWNWSFTVPDTPGYSLHFYHDCDTGCQTWTSVATGAAALSEENTAAAELIPTKLGVVFANPERDWHNRRGWDVELTYAQLAEEEYWGIDDLAARVQVAADKGLLVLVRVDYAQGQSIPPPNDFAALDSYLSYVKRLARDDRLQNVYGYLIGSGFNTRSGNSQSPEYMVTPEWYARLFNGYGLPPERRDNVVQTMRVEKPAVRILVGPVTPWRTDQDGQIPYQIDVPWLNYFNTLVVAIDQAAQEKADQGIVLAAPDGFAVQASANPDAPEIATFDRADEARIDIRRPEWHGAQAGFRVYQDWLDVINTYPHTRGRPVFITSTNTYEFETDTAPAGNYPSGWLTAAVETVNQEPQIMALCWYLDWFPHDDQWAFFSLTEPRGQMTNAAKEFDRILESVP